MAEAPQVHTLPVLAEEAGQHVRSLQLSGELNRHRHFAELWRLNSNESLRALLVSERKHTTNQTLYGERDADLTQQECELGGIPALLFNKLAALC